MIKSLIKTTSLLLIMGLTWTGISAVKSTMAYFNDAEGYKDNELIAGILDFSLSSDSDFSPEITPLQESVRYIDIINDGSLGFEYSVYASDFSGDIDLCNNLNLTANLDGDAVEYNGDLTAFNYNAGEFSDPDNWEFKVILDGVDPALEYKTCTFKFIFEAEQTGDCYGFSDVEEITNTVESSGWSLGEEELLINKTYFHLLPEHGIELKNQWVELYNNSGDEIDINGWTISDNNGSDVLAISELIIPSNGYAIITGSGTTWNYWNIPSGVIKIVLADGTIGDGLENSRDMLILKNKNGIVVDQMNWGIPDEMWTNYNSNLWNPGISSIAEANRGEMFGRKPNGYDTNSRSDFWQYILPKVSVSYYSGLWYCSRFYGINWTAQNGNGPDEDLLIDIVYIRDTDGTGEISNGDSFETLKEKTANTGTYAFYIDESKGYCFYGYVWIKIIAYGSENIMMQSYGVGPRVWEPPLPELEYNPDGTCRLPLSKRFRDMFIAPNVIETPIVPGVETTTPEQDGVQGENQSNSNNGIFNQFIGTNTIIDIPDMDVVNATTSAEDGTNPPDNNENE